MEDRLFEIEVRLEVIEAVMKGITSALPNPQLAKEAIEIHLSSIRARAATLKTKYPEELGPQQVANAIEKDVKRWLRTLVMPGPSK